MVPVPIVASVTTVTSVPSINNTSNNDQSHAGFLVPKKTITEMDESIRCSLLILQHEEHLKTTALQLTVRKQKQVI
jgi:hypothetical protein